MAAVNAPPACLGDGAASNGTANPLRCEVNDAPAFIHSMLDDYGLDAPQFRVVCRIARRGDCFESIPNIAKGCRLNEKTVKAAIKFSVEQKIVSREYRTGNTCLIKINPVSLWIPHPHRGPEMGGPKRSPHPPPKRSPQGGPKRSPPGWAQTEPPKVYPSEGPPIKESTKGEAPQLSASLKELLKLDIWRLEKDENRLVKQIHEEEETARGTDRVLLIAMRDRLSEVREARKMKLVANQPARPPVPSKPTVQPLDMDEEVVFAGQNRTVRRWIEGSGMPMHLLVEAKAKEQRKQASN